MGSPVRTRTEYVADEAAMRALAGEWVRSLEPGDVVCLSGPLGAGKTTFVRGALAGLGYTGAVRSPTFNLIQSFATDPPVVHADLYRLESAQGLGLEAYLNGHVLFIEWPERASALLDRLRRYDVEIKFHSEGRSVTIRETTD